MTGLKTWKRGWGKSHIYTRPCDGKPIRSDSTNHRRERWVACWWISDTCNSLTIEEEFLLSSVSPSQSLCHSHSVPFLFSLTCSFSSCLQASLAWHYSSTAKGVECLHWVYLCALHWDQRWRQSYSTGRLRKRTSLRQESSQKRDGAVGETPN